MVLYILIFMIIYILIWERLNIPLKVHGATGFQQKSIKGCKLVNCVGRILTMDNLCKWGITIVDWLFLCKASSNNLGDHLLLYYLVARELWSFVFFLFVVKWVKSRTVVDFLACWNGKHGHHANNMIWNSIAPSIMQIIQRKKNS